MDLRVIPEGLTEPTMSGVIFQRQAQLRWSLPLGESFKFDLAADDPASTDVFENQSLEARYPVPDYIASVDYSRLGMGHVRIGGVARRLKN